ncbi:MAG: VOC family protein [Prochloraceae cyanobacterium]|nr:VOC family protein [Prochloraceae cyanobacterium]
MESVQQSINHNSLYGEGVHLKRPCLAVADLERSLSIYRDILGFKLDYVSEASPNSYLYSVFRFPKSARLKFAVLSSEYETRALALTEVKGFELPPPNAPYRAGIVIRVAELDPVIEKIRELGLNIIEPNTFNAPPNLCFTEQAFCDRDGHLIIIYQVKIS